MNHIYSGGFKVRQIRQIRRMKNIYFLPIFFLINLRIFYYGVEPNFYDVAKINPIPVLNYDILIFAMIEQR